MKYKLLSVYKLEKSALNEVDIEVNRDSGANTIAPFMRKVTVEELVYNELSSPKEMVYLLNQLGYTKQPFVLKRDIVGQLSVQNILRQNRWTYKKIGKGSLYRADPLYVSGNNHTLHKGKLLFGELYITDLTHWNKHIKVRVVYKGAVNSFYPIYNDLPCSGIENVMFLRDELSERSLLNHVSQYMDSNGLGMSLVGFNIDVLKSLSDAGWKVYVEDNKGKISQVHAHQNKSGIVWFDRNESVNDDDGIIGQLLSGYLNGRNYVDAGKNLGIFRSKDITAQKNTDLAVEMLPVDGDVAELYKKNESLTRQEISYIESRLEEGVHATLRTYQWEGVKWLATMRKNHKGCLLADEMGLGKTLQVLSHFYTIKNSTGPFLIIVPTSLLPNWENEVRTFVPSWSDDVTIQSHEPGSKNKIILVSYDILRLNISTYKRISYDTVVIDEAQIIKNRDTQKYKVISQLKAYHRIILTGTPIENSINDIWSHFMILMPPLKKVFKIVTKDKTDMNNPEFMEISKKLLKPFILRRTKAEELRKLPRLNETTVYIDLTHRERTIYNNVKGVFLKALQTGISGRLNSIALEGLLRLRQTCVSPNLLPSTLYKGEKFKSSKMRKVFEMIMNSVLVNKKVLVFSQFVSALEEMEGCLKDVGHVHLYGSTTNRKTCVSAFQNDPSIKVFLISLKAGGVGLNLTAATTVILLDDWWNPAVEEQAFARAHRIGQHHDVTVYRLVCRDTVEEKILQLQDKKRQTVNIFNAASNRLTTEELMRLLT